jgi:hypothetical protein
MSAGSFWQSPSMKAISPDPGVKGGGLTAAATADPGRVEHADHPQPRMVGKHLLQQLLRSIRRAVIDHDELVLERRRIHRGVDLLDEPAHVVLLIVGGGHDRKRRRLTCFAHTTG